MVDEFGRKEFTDIWGVPVVREFPVGKAKVVKSDGHLFECVWLEIPVVRVQLGW